MSLAIQLEAMAEDALLLRFGSTIDSAVNARVHAAVSCLQQRWPALECVPAYASLLLRFHPEQWQRPDGGTPHQQIGDAMLEALTDLQLESTNSRLIEIPVCYGDADGPDLAEVATITGLTTDEVIARHCAAEYCVAMLGFAPGFPYLLGLDPLLAVPRRTDPRQRVAAGSVAIGGNQTGIYPDELPGGWQLIGRTPLCLFDAAIDTPSLLATGDRVRFHAIDQLTYRQLAADHAQ